MSKFYSNYCEAHNQEKPIFLQREEINREIQKTTSVSSKYDY